jgi:mannose-1-phosphate guanylyltransferase
MINIILCGGSGTRLWPLSRTLYPKQFIKLFDDKSLFQLTLERNSVLCNANFVVSNSEQYFLALEQEEEISVEKGSSSYMLEPVGRNTAPAIALACMALDTEEIVLVTPSDHLIKDEEAYKEVIIKAKKEVEKNNLVTFGITPSYPEIGFGYIEADGLDVKSFKEKPDVETAKSYIEKGNYYWNSGMFMFKAGIFLEELKKYSPEIYKTSEIAFSKTLNITDKQFKIKTDDMLNIPEDSIDYAVMESSDRVKVIPSDIMWSDLGDFNALSTEIDKMTPDDCTPISIDSKNNLIISNKQVATIDIEDLVIIDTPDALLISKKESTQKVKNVVAKLKEQNSELTKVHTLAHRPWGTYEVLLSTEQYKIKRIIVNQGKRLSLQKHFHRNEHWIVVSGTATVTVGNEKKLIRPNESTYIKMGEIHRLENEGKIPVVLIEAQVGEYTGEDDIIRLEDDFQREN